MLSNDYIFALIGILEHDEIDLIASTTTVLIAEGIDKGDYESGWLDEDPQVGSGVLIGKQGTTYFVLTALHNIRTKGITYGVRTPSDRNVHFFNDSNIIPLGQEEGLGTSIKGYDLALIKFKSRKKYPLISLGKSDDLQSGYPLYISGWPLPDTPNIRRERVLQVGVLQKLVPEPFSDGGYSMLYSNKTRVGMSGGPVLNEAGQLVGIHGRGRGQGNKYCVDPRLSLRNSCGMQTIHFLSAADSRQIRLAVNRKPLTPKQKKNGLKNKKKADVVNNIFKDFSQTETLLRYDRPSGGCQSLLLGEKQCP